MKTFEEVVKKLEDELKKNPLITQKLQNIVRETHSIQVDQGYCASFDIPEKQVKELIELVGLNEDELKEIFDKELGFPKDTKMYGNPYYHILLLLYYVYKKLRMDRPAKMALYLILIRVWNGRKYKYIKYCNTKIMEYVIQNLITRRHLASKYRTPSELISVYFVTTLDKKYGSLVLSDYKKLKLLFNQCFVRIDQLYNNPQKTGIANLYYKAHKEGLAVSTMKNEEGLVDIEGEHEKLIKYAQFIANSIVLDAPAYSSNFIDFINTKTRVSKDLIKKMLECLHKPTHKEQIYELLLLFFGRIKVVSVRALCGELQNVINFVDRLFLSSKHNPDVEHYKSILRELTKEILHECTGQMMEPQIHHLRVIAYGLMYNVSKYTCMLREDM